MVKINKIFRTKERKIAGVCGGLAKYFEIDVQTMRIIWLAAVLLAGTGGLLYIIAWLLLPEER